MSTTATEPLPCRRCKTEPGHLKLRNLPTCSNCYVEHVDSKMRKRLGALNKDAKNSRELLPRRYLAGLSFGPSSTTMMWILNQSAEYHATKKASSPIEPVVVHIDTGLSPSETANSNSTQELLATYGEKFPLIRFEYIHLSKVLDLKTVDWSIMPGSVLDLSKSADDRLKSLFDAMPSVTAQKDLSRVLIRHLLIDATIRHDCSTLFLGHNTTTLAATTLSEVASGRGFSVPCQVNDGPLSVCIYEHGSEISRTELPVYYPLREVLKHEITTYMSLVPELQNVETIENHQAGNLVSYKDVSIEEVMMRYFEGVEGAYSGIVTNVVRTTGKLDRKIGQLSCRLCGMCLDEKGDSRWAGELDEPEQTEVLQRNSHLCYGCRRTING